MITKLTLTCVSLAITVMLHAQRIKKDTLCIETKMDIAVSRTGAIIKIVDTELPYLDPPYLGLETQIRKVVSGGTTSYFYQVGHNGKYNRPSIEYTDLLQLLEAFKTMQQQALKDVNSAKPYYTENKFVTVDGFEIGYTGNKRHKVNWYMKLAQCPDEIWHSFNKPDIIEKAFTEAKNKIEQLQKEDVKTGATN